MRVRNILRQIETPYIDAQNLLALLGGYKRPRDWVARMVKNGELIRIRNGFYLISEKIERGSTPFEQIANVIYGPSYVSLEWALSFYGMIPERAYTVTSITLGREKEYRTPIGHFTYTPLNADAYAIGVDLKESIHSTGSFLMATREKALVDFVFKKCKGTTAEELRTELLESYRINFDIIRELDKDFVFDVVKNHKSKRIKFLREII